MLERTIDIAQRGWRLIGTGLAFAAFFLGGLVLALTVLPLLGLAGRQPTWRVQAFIRQVFRLYLWLVETLGVLRLDVIEGDRLADIRGKLIVANHPTLLDVVFLMALMPRASCIVKSELFGNLFLGGVVRAAGYLRNDLPVEELVAESRRILDEGGNLIVFPEGTRTRPGQALQFQRGCANIALLARADLQLVVITCHPLTLTKGEPWYRIPPQKPVFRVEIAHAVPIENFARNGYRGLESRTLTRELEQYFAARLRSEPGAGLGM